VNRILQNGEAKGKNALGKIHQLSWLVEYQLFSVQRVRAYLLAS